VAALVEDSQWLAAQLARDHAVHAYLQAIPLSHDRRWRWMASSASPATCANRTGCVRCRPGSPPHPMTPRWPSTTAGLAKGIAAAVALRYAVADAAGYAAPLLRERSQDDFDAPLAYWMRLVLEQRPDDLATLEDTLYFLYPRWGGSHEAMENFIEGSWCRGLELAQSNALRWRKEQDWMGDLPHREDADAVAAHERAYTQILDWHLDRHLRAQVLAQRAGLRYRLAALKTAKTSCSGIGPHAGGA
jgi:hypothetical protein